MNNLRKQHDILESQTAQTFSELLNKLEQDVILSTKQEQYYECEMVELYDEILGGSFSVYIVGFKKEGLIKTVAVENEIEEEYRLSDFVSLLDRINIVEILEAQINF